MIDTSKIIYSLNIEDVQNVAEEEFERAFSKKELKIVEDKVGEYVDWYGAIERTIWNKVLSRGENRNEQSMLPNHHNYRR
jgi:hypothetical protein